MWRDDPGIDQRRILSMLEREFGVLAESVTFLPLGYDLGAAVYEVLGADGLSWFLKLRAGPVYEPGLRVPLDLAERHIPNVLAPAPTRGGALWTTLDESDTFTVVLYPFIRGESAVIRGLDDRQWRDFGATLRAAHDSGLAERFRNDLRIETFTLPSANLVEESLVRLEVRAFRSEAATRFASFCLENMGQIHAVLDRGRELGRALAGRTFHLVLCHGDIHAANIVAGEDGRIWLVDWDSPLIAPRERDLLFVVGSRIARPVEPREEELFFAGYGPFDIDPEALAYFRYERIVEDLGEFARSVFFDSPISEQSRAEAVGLAVGFFEPGGDIDRAEVIPRTRWPG